MEMKSRRDLLLFVVLFVLTGCARRPAPANHRQPLVSPSGKYVLTLPIERAPAYANARVWKVTISDRQGDVLYKDNTSTFVGYLMVYWIWDAADRVWLYNSDDGRTFFWELTDGKWVKKEWTKDEGERTVRALAPPPSLYPDYAK